MTRTRLSAALAVTLRFAIVFAAAAPVVCQDEARPYFSISSARTFGPSETPVIALSGWHVEAVQIRVYRVNNPVKFVSELENPHGFGSTP
ncbi:MAG TPA: hypothetical protein VFU86_07325, partial [Terriglobales bacterium]|nr:hypothetical protein [Terriglobales bacterium]